jgi:CDP-diacylglycerol--glycerol-3-phosphate 3-phosphatidyltransferase
MANLLTLARVLLIFGIIGVWSREVAVGAWWLDALMVPLLAWAIFMDATDGWAARKYNEASEAGALFDIAGDRIVELALWTYFAVRVGSSGDPLVPLWVPLLMIARTVATDLVRSVAFGHGRTPFGPNSMQNSWWALQLTSARWSRGLYGGLKAVAFCGLGILVALDNVPNATSLATPAALAVEVLVLVTVMFGLLRALSVLWEGRRFFRPRPEAQSESVGAIRE